MSGWGIIFPIVTILPLANITKSPAIELGFFVLSRKQLQPGQALTGRPGH